MAPAPYTAIFMSKSVRHQLGFAFPPWGKVERSAGRGVCQGLINRFSHFNGMLEHIDIEESQDAKPRASSQRVRF